jgi:hypothetical protein
MTEFVTLVALGVLFVGLGVLCAAALLTTVGWLLLQWVRHGSPPSPDRRSASVPHRT